MRPRLLLSLLLVASLVSGGCFEGEEGEQFYGRVVVPRGQEFRWSDGGLPRVFDPARAAAPPDTDAVRALFEGLTDSDPRTLEPLPAVALRWEASADWRQWTFHLRRDATWSNGDRVTAEDFVRSWQRTLRLEDAPHAQLLANIRGARDVAGESRRAPETAPSVEAARTGAAAAGRAAEPQRTPAPREPFGAEAVDTHTLRVTLGRPDKSFPALVAHPVFRPFHELSPSADRATIEDEVDRGGDAAEPSSSSVVTNGAFRLSNVGGGSVVLERAANYWAASAVKLDRVRFVETKSAEEALAAYKAGEVDAVTNAALEPLAVKILTPYKDFRRGTFGALLYYQFNTKRPPFDDQRVREAFAVALDVERLSADTLGGATEPAYRFLPGQLGADAREARDADAPSASPSSAVDGEGNAGGSEADEGDAGQTVEGDEAKNVEGDADEWVVPVARNVERARRLLAEAGYPGGAGLRPLRLLVNRNEQQRLLAQAAARMWRDALGVEVRVEVRDWELYEAERAAGEFEIVRRSIVLQTTDEETNILSMFGDEPSLVETEVAAAAGATPSPTAGPNNSAQPAAQPSPEQARSQNPILSEAQALRELPAVPVYFASSYALVKPYVGGFDSNLLDAPSLKHVRIETGWKPPARRAVSVLTFARP